MADIIVVLILCVVLFFAIRYIVKAKKNGACIGCPNSSQCSGGCNCNKSKKGCFPRKTFPQETAPFPI